MKKYFFLGTAVLALLHHVECHVHNHRHGGRLLRREMHQSPSLGAERCAKVPPTTTTVVVHIDEHGRPLGTSMSLSDFNQNHPVQTVMSTHSHNKRQQTARYMPIPQATDLNPLDPNFVPDTINDFLTESDNNNNNNNNNNNYGISYSPYNADGSCKTQGQVDNDMHQLRKKFAYVRFYGVDCNQAQTITKAARDNEMQVFAGVFDLSNMHGDLQKIIDAAHGDWGVFHTVSVGNELVNTGQNSPAEVAGAVESARALLRRAGYQGPVVTVDTVNAIIANPELCDASDYCAVNCHAFFDGTQTPDNAGPYVLEQARRVSEASKGGNKKVIITESGWPTAGEANGRAVPSKENQMRALKSLKQSFPDGGVVFFSAFNDEWKQDNAWTFGTEKHWGLV